MRTSALNEQIAWLLHHGYHAVSVQDILDAHHGIKPLPAKAFLLSFDDGYSSFYTRVWPLLKAWNVPALWAPVGSWVDTPAGQPVNFGGLMTPRERFATWEMVRELSRSPLVEIGAHTWASHYGLPANPQGSREPAAANRGWDKTTGRYESDAQFTRRMADDVQKVTAKIHEVAGKAPRAWVWPYGAASGSTLAIAKQQGYQLAFTLNDGLGNVKDLDNIPRMLIAGNPSIKAFANAVTQIQEADPVRVMHVDLDYVYDPNPVQQAKNIDKLVQRVYDMKISHVFLQAFSDPQGDGTVKSLYFPNRWLPMRADLFNFVSWQLQTRGGVKVYAWMPVLAFDLSSDLPRVQRWDPQTGKALLARQPYVRLSPWDPRVRQQIMIRMLFHHTEQLVSRLSQGGMAKSTLVDQLKVEAGGGTQLNNGRHVERENHGVFYLAEGHGGPFNNRLNVVFITATRFPGFQADKRHAGVLPLAAEAEAVNGKDAFNIGFLVMQIVVGYGIQHLLRALLGRAGRQLDHGQEDALILVGQKGRGQTHEQHGHPHDYHQVDHQITACSTQNAAKMMPIKPIRMRKN